MHASLYRRQARAASCHRAGAVGHRHPGGAAPGEDGVIPALRPLIERLQATGYYMSNDLVAEVLASLGE